MSTASLRHASSLVSTEMAPLVSDHIRSLGRHLRHCREAQGRFFGLSRLATDLHGWVAPRFVTTLALAAALIALACC